MNFQSTCCDVCSSTDLYKGLSNVICNVCNPVTGIVPTTDTPSSTTERVWLKETGSYEWPAGKYVVSYEEKLSKQPYVFRITFDDTEMRIWGPKWRVHGYEVYATPVTANRSCIWNDRYRHPHGAAGMSVSDLLAGDELFIPKNMRQS